MPNTGGAGQPVTITGTNLSTVTEVRFGNRLASGTKVVSQTTLIAYAPAGLLNGAISVRNPSGTATSKQLFTSNLYRIGPEAHESVITSQATGRTFNEVFGGLGSINSMAPLGDVNGDGVDDIAVGIPGDGMYGSVVILFLDSPPYPFKDLEFIGGKVITRGKSGFTGTVAADGGFGTSVAAIGDIDLDGVPDLAVGSMRDDGSEGSVWILFMKADGTVKSSRQLGQGDFGLGGFDGFGSSLDAIQDLDGNGTQEIVVSSQFEDGDKGNVRILFLEHDGRVYKVVNIGSALGTELQPLDAFGTSLASAGDIDGDGIEDLIVGAPKPISGTEGNVYLIFLNASGNVKKFTKINASNAQFAPTEQLRLGWGCDGAQDMDQDGTRDIILTAINEPADDDPAKINGQMYALLLNKDGSVKDTKLLYQGGSLEATFPMMFYGMAYSDGYPLLIFSNILKPDAPLNYLELDLAPLMFISNKPHTWDNFDIADVPAEIRPAPDTLVFNATTVGVPIIQKIHITPAASNEFTRMRIEKPIVTGDFKVNTTSFPELVGITMNEEFVFDLQFNATNKGTFIGTMTIYSGDYLQFPHQFIIKATALDFPPSVSPLAVSIPENTPAATQIATVIASDPDGFPVTLSIVSGNTSSAFSIDTSTGALSVNNQAAIDFEVNPVYTLTIRATDKGGQVANGIVTVTLTNINEAPVGISLSGSSIPENVNEGSTIGTLAAVDPDAGDTFSYSFENLPLVDNGLFSLLNDIVVMNIKPDYESKSTYTIAVRVTDGGGLSVVQQLQIVVQDVPEVPIVTDASFSIDENSAPASIVGAIDAEDDDNDIARYEIVAGNAGNAFSIAPATGVISVNSTGVVNFEALPQYVLSIQVTDSTGLMSTGTAVVNIVDLNERPTALVLSNNQLSENFPDITKLGQLSTVDEDQPEAFYYELVDGSGPNDNAAFILSGEYLFTRSSFDFETKSSYLVTVRVTDKGALQIDSTFTITVIDINEPPVVANLAVTVDENTSQGTSVAQAVASDPEKQSITYAITNGNIGNAFSIDATTGEILVNVQSELDYEKVIEFTLEITAYDNTGIPGVGTIVIHLADMNEAPTDILLSATTLPENQQLGSFVGMFSTDDQDQDDTHNYSLTAGSGDQDNQFFAISGDSLLTAAYFSFEFRSSYSIRIKSTDKGGLSVEKAFEIAIADINESALLFVPTLFSPNGDGSNDFFLVHSDEVRDIELSIHSATYGEVFSTSDVYTATKVGWDGSSRGNPLVPGVYTWSIKGHFQDGTPVTFKGSNRGTVMLVR